MLSLILCGYSCSFPPRHPEPPEGTYDHDSPFAQTPTALATRLPRARASASTAGGTLGGGGGVGGFGFGEGGLGGGGQNGSVLGGGLAGAGVGAGGIAGRSRRRPLIFPPSNMSPLPSSSGVVAAAAAAAANHNHPPPRPLTPAPHANGMSPDMADVIALRSQLAELGMMAGFSEPFSASPSVGGGRPGGGGGPVLAIAERRVE